MESARTIFNRNTPSGPPISYGSGDYFYVLANSSSPNQLVCIDKSLLTAGNYLGGGTWTSNPVIANISLSTTGYKLCVYNALTREVWVSGVAAGDIKCIDANPLSSTFNTVTRTLIPSFGGFGGSGGAAGAYNSAKQKMVFNNTSNVLEVNAITGLTEASISKVTANHGKYFEPLKSYLQSDETTAALSILDIATGLINFYATSVSANTMGIWSSLKYLYLTKSGSVEVYNSSFTLVATVTLTNVRSTRSAFSEKNNKLITGSFFTNSFSFLNELTLTSAGNLAKGYTGVNESGTREIVASDDVAIALPSGVLVPTTTFTHVHAIDVSTQAYIGYVPLGATLGDFTNQNEYNGHTSCKNRIEV